MKRRSTGTSTPSAEGFWAVTRYDDVRAVSRDHETFSAELGSTFIVDQEPDALEMIRMTILNMDPPKHSRYRRLVSAGFTPRMIGRLIDHIASARHGHRRQRRGTRRDRLRRGGRRRASAPDDLRDDRRARRGPASDLRLEQPAGWLPGRGLPHLGGRRPDGRGRDLRILRGNRGRSSRERPRRHHDRVRSTPRSTAIA